MFCHLYYLDYHFCLRTVFKPTNLLNWQKIKLVKTVTLEFRLVLQGFTDQLPLIWNYFHNYFIKFSHFLRTNIQNSLIQSIKVYGLLLYDIKQNISGLWTKQTFKDVIETFGKHWSTFLLLSAFKDQTTNWLIKKINDRLTNNENNH